MTIVSIPRVVIQNMVEQAYCDGMRHERRNPIRNTSLTRSIAGRYAANRMPTVDEHARRTAREIEQPHTDQTPEATR
jgi:hypothetical protein